MCYNNYLRSCYRLKRKLIMNITEMVYLQSTCKRNIYSSILFYLLMYYVLIEPSSIHKLICNSGFTDYNFYY